MGFPRTPPRFTRTRLPAGGSGVWAFVLLAVLGFGGGLSLALFSFNGGSDHGGVRISSGGPELMYQRPASAGMGGVSDFSAVKGSTDAAHPNVALLSLGGVQKFASDAVSATDVAQLSLARSEELFPAEMSFAGVLPFAGYRGADGAMQGQLADADSSAAASLLDYAPASEAFSSTGLLPVPEPSTWTMLLIGGGALLTTLRRRRNSRSEV
ncbi:MAG: PEP-CTERM sorting domain-containing protein [Verrucomicrobiota bacterium]|nr:PEP-CTERM sorting domain-containing protein [Verrucomicrobiota bacterium]